MTTLRFVIGEYRRYFSWFLIGALTTIGATLARVTLPVYVKLAVDSLAGPEKLANEGAAGALALMLVWADPANPQAFIVACLALVLIFAVIQGVFLFYTRYYLIRLSRRSEYALKKQVYEHLQKLPQRYFDRTRSGGIMSLMTSDIEAVRMMIGPAILYLGGTVTMAPAALTVLFSINPFLTWLALAPLFGLTLATLWFSPRVRKYSQLAQEELERMSARAQESIAGTRVVKAFTREQFEIDEMRRMSAAYTRHKLAGARNSALYGACVWVFGGMGVLLILYFGAREIAAGRFSLGDFSAFILYNVQLYWPMIALGWVTMLFVRGDASLKRLFAVLAEPIDPAQAGKGDGLPVLRGEIEFRDVALVYQEGAAPALDGVSFHVPAGTTLGIVGPVGSGKSSIASLLLQLSKPTRGEILIDGRPVELFDARALRGHFGYVPQESFLFSETVRDNIALGLPEGEDANAARVAQALGDAAFADEVAALPNGLDTMLGERGVNLSGGQKQRAAIARALARDVSVLVLDDCLSAVDTHTEERILSALKRRSRALTTLIIAQRISSVAHADQIVVLDHGRVVQRGTDAELREVAGLYADLARRQELAAELA